eukprot:NODE_4183_length_329_cov_2.614286_g4101_i0.p3 GENE.NODE_4183_length_329_cov_2.614286_g4101_i0~~NODE_4183_length_329_cov_2.614286_g4101_i0.p3  ORF type:complete len:66 (-),score=6.00 NODE_4183_length_329_cov_2.614286_g4101_i0:130-300(-)
MGCLGTRRAVDPGISERQHVPVSQAHTAIVVHFLIGGSIQVPRVDAYRTAICVIAP